MHQFRRVLSAICLILLFHSLSSSLLAQESNADDALNSCDQLLSSLAQEFQPPSGEDFHTTHIRTQFPPVKEMLKDFFLHRFDPFKSYPGLEMWKDSLGQNVTYTFNGTPVRLHIPLLDIKVNVPGGTMHMKVTSLEEMTNEPTFVVQAIKEHLEESRKLKKKRFITAGFLRLVGFSKEASQKLRSPEMGSILFYHEGEEDKLHRLRSKPGTFGLSIELEFDFDVAPDPNRFSVDIIHTHPGSATPLSPQDIETAAGVQTFFHKKYGFRPRVRIIAAPIMDNGEIIFVSGFDRTH